MRLIDADELKKALAEMWYEKNIRITGLSVAELIDEAPTIEPSGDLISREEAIEAVMAEGRNVHASEYANAERIIHETDAVEALAMLPSAEYSKPLQTTLNGDLVSREEALDVVCKELQFQEENRIPYDSHDNGTCFGLKKAKELLLALPSAARPTLKQTDTLIIADALRYLIKDTERHEIDRTRAEELREQILQYGASMCSSAERPSADVVHKPDYSYEADMVKRLKEATSADKPNYNLETIADIVKQLGHLDGCIADILDRPQVNQNSAEEQIAETCDKPKVNSAEWVAEKEKEFEELHRPKGECDDKPEPYVPEASTERVVHCKDCIYSRQPEEELFVCENRFGMSGWVRENEFCSSGSL